MEITGYTCKDVIRIYAYVAHENAPNTARIQCEITGGVYGMQDNSATVYGMVDVEVRCEISKAQVTSKCLRQCGLGEKIEQFKAEQIRPRVSILDTR